MNGKITERFIKKGLDKNGKMKENLKVYDVYYRYKEASTGKWKQTSKKGFRTKKEADDFRLIINTQFNNNTFVPQKRTTLKEYLEKWINDYSQQLKKTTISSYKYIINFHIVPKLGNIELQKLTSSNIDSFYSDKMKNGRLDGKGGLSKTSVNYIHRVLRESLEHAIKKGEISTNPIKNITIKPKSQKYKAQYYDLDEIISLLEVIKGTEMECPIILACLCGLRRGEVLGLTWDNIDFLNSCININQQLISTDEGFYFDTPKSESSIRTVFVPPIAMKILKNHKYNQDEYKRAYNKDYNGNNLAYCNIDGTPVNPKSFSKRFAYFLKKNNLKHIRFHDLRHSYASLAVALEIPMKVTSESMGHANMKITSDLYTHVSNNLKKDMANKIDNLLIKSINISY